jgi:drug/metabolite transporter (DMT)-like permease
MISFTLKSTAVFAYICTASITGYTLWYYVLKSNSLSKMFIIKFAEPLFACAFGAVLLGENIFKIQYLLAFILISVGIILGNKSEKSNEK